MPESNCGTAVLLALRGFFFHGSRWLRQALLSLRSLALGLLGVLLNVDRGCCW